MSRSRIGALLAVVALLVTVLVIALTRGGDDDEGPTAASTTTAAPPTTAPGPTSTTSPPPPTIPAVVPDGEGITVPYAWKPVRLGGGGNISGIDAADDGTLIARSDTYGAYLRPAGATEWRQLLVTSALPAEFHVPKMGKGVQSVAIAPSDPSRLYLMWAGHVLRSTDSGTTFTTTPYEPVNSDANAGFGKGFGDKLVVDPANPDVVLAGGPDVPLRISRDGGDTWTDTTVPAGLPQERLAADYEGQINSVGITGLAFDRSAGVAEGGTSVVYAASWGNGVYRSTDGGTTWTSIGGPTAVHHASVDADGAYYASSGDQNGPFSVQRYDGSAWTDITPDDWEPGYIASVENPFIAASPVDAGTVVVGYAPQMFVTRDGGGSWSEMTWHDGTGDVTWAQNPDDDYYLVASDLIFDPAAPNELWLTTGEGTQHATLGSGNELEWLEATRGIENMVTTDVASTLDGPTVFGVYDFGQFGGSADLDDFSLAKGPVPFFSGTTSLASSPFTPGFAVSVTTDYVTDALPVSSSYTTDGGATWTKFGSLPRGSSAKDFGYGAIAVSTADNIVWSPGRYFGTETTDFQPYYTLDRGETWSPVELPGVTAYPADTISGYMFGRNRQGIVADEVAPGVFYLSMVGEGVFRSSDGGVTWERRHDGDFSEGDSSFSSSMGAMPGREGELFYTDGPVGGHDFIGAQKHEGTPFLRSTDGGATWAPVDGVDKVLGFGFGAAAPGALTGTIYLAGNVNGTYGIWRSTDDALTWEGIGDYPLTVDWLGVLSGDRNTFGTVYVGTGGSSYVYGTPTSG